MQVVKYPKPAQKKETRRNQILWRYISSLECLPAPAEKEGKNKKGESITDFDYIVAIESGDE